jgi:uncharacterized protein (DUF433 family)
VKVHSYSIAGSIRAEGRGQGDEGAGIDTKYRTGYGLRGWECVLRSHIRGKEVELESYFDFVSPEEIRIKGSRIGIETVLEDYVDGASPEEIAARYRNLTLEQVYATLLYYFHNREQVEAYLEAWRKYTEQARLQWGREPSPVGRRLRDLKARRASLQAETATP